MKELRFENLFTPEYYLEIPGYDCRIAVMKLIDARNTMGMALFSLECIDTGKTDDTNKIFARTVHLRHAIYDLNSSFDLLLQIPWFFYRIWEKHSKIKRNTLNWVSKVEKMCREVKVKKYVKDVLKNKPLRNKINEFENLYISNSNKDFTVRTLCNEMKHNHALSFKELYNSYNCLCSFPKQKINIKNSNVSMTVDIKYENIYNKDEVILGKYSYNDDLSIDFECSNGEFFRFEDCSHKLLKIQDVYKECCDYYDALVDLFEEIYKNVYPNLIINPTFCDENGKPKIKISADKMNLNEFFSIT
ncbi:MAG: hypothetical protein ACI4I6_03450 [Hominimerdicola sp.]